jgi:ABC-type antimicrobial peptide transport system permease subunit
MRLKDIGSFAIRDAKESSTSLITNIVAILFGTVLTALLLALVFGAGKIMNETLSRVPLIDGVNIWVDYSTGQTPITREEYESLQKYPEVETVVTDVKQLVYLYDNASMDYLACLAGTEKGDPEITHLTLVKGATEVNPDGWDVILTQQVAFELNRFDPEGLVGKNITMELRRYDTLDSPDESKPSKVIKYPLRVVGIVKFSPGNRIYTSMNVTKFVRDFSTMRSNYEPAPGDKVDVSQISSRTMYEGVTLHYKDGRVAEKNFMSLKHEFGNRFEVTWPGEEYLWLRDVQLVASLVLLCIGLLTVVAGSISVFNTLQASVMRKIREIGILRALGVTQIEVFLIFVFQSVLIGSSAAIIGLVLALVGIPAINSTIKAYWKLEINTFLTLPPIPAIAIFLSVIFICMVAALFPSWKASKVTPMDAIRTSGQ